MDLGSGFQMRHGWRKSASTVLGTRLICEKNDVSTLSNVKNSDELSFATFAARDTLQQYVDSPDRRTREDSPRTLYGCARAPCSQPFPRDRACFTGNCKRYPASHRTVVRTQPLANGATWKRPERASETSESMKVTDKYMNYH